MDGGKPHLKFVGLNGALNTDVNYEVDQEYNVTVSVTDQVATSAINVVVPVIDMNDNTPYFTTGHTTGNGATLLDHGPTLAEVQVQEGTGNNVVVYRAQAEDLDTNLGGNAALHIAGHNDAITFAMLPGLDASLFNFNNGELQFKTSAAVGTYSVNVTATDEASHTVNRR